MGHISSPRAPLPRRVGIKVSSNSFEEASFSLEYRTFHRAFKILPNPLHCSGASDAIL